MAETKLTFKRIGNYSTRQADPTDSCIQCGDDIWQNKWGSVLIDGMCAECLIELKEEAEKNKRGKNDQILDMRFKERRIFLQKVTRFNENGSVIECSDTRKTYDRRKDKSTEQLADFMEEWRNRRQGSILAEANDILQFLHNGYVPRDRDSQ